MDQGTSKIERHVPAIPLSKEVSQFAELKKSLVLYRMVFGQNRQEDLINYLQQQASDVELQELAQACRIDLSPPKNQHAQNTQKLPKKLAAATAQNTQNRWNQIQSTIATFASVYIHTLLLNLDLAYVIIS